MGNSKKIFTKTKITPSSKNVIQKVKYNRQQLLSKDVAYELNTYLNFGVFPTFADTFLPYFEKDGSGKYVYGEDPKQKGSSGVGVPGVRSLFNRAGAVILGTKDGSCQVDVGTADPHSWRIANNVPLIDSPKARQRIRQSSGCSIKELVDASQTGAMGRATYAYSDFMYCKHLGKVSNNYMVTLRRFPFPVDDYIGAMGETDDTRIATSSQNTSCIGCMVTWMGVSGNDLSNILKYNYKMPFKDEQSEWQDNKASADQNAGIMNGLFSAFDSTYRAQYQAGYAGNAANSAFEAFGIKGLGNPPYTDHASFRDTKTKIYGPIDSIRSTYVRADSGLTFDQKISLVFEYELRAYNGINAKQAMLDLISNILNITYTTGSFWGGGIKGFAAHQSNIFTNLEIFKARGGATDFADAFAKDLGTLNEKIGANIKASGGIIAAFKQLLNGLGGMLISGVLNKWGRPKKAMYNALLSPAPIGFWHVTIGNPKRPIMTIGNMVITNCSVEHNGPLGLDDFPTGLKVTVELDRGKPRDLRDIEKLYMQGTNRIYSSMSDKVFDMYKNSELYKANRNNLAEYKPVSNTTKITGGTTEKGEAPTIATVTVEDYAKLESTMRKYFGTTDTYSIYVPAAEQEYGAGKKKPSTEQNKNIKGGN